MGCHRAHGIHEGQETDDNIQCSDNDDDRDMVKTMTILEYNFQLYKNLIEEIASIQSLLFFKELRRASMKFLYFSIVFIMPKAFKWNEQRVTLEEVHVEFTCQCTSRDIEACP